MFRSDQGLTPSNRTWLNWGILDEKQYWLDSGLGQLNDVCSEEETDLQVQSGSRAPAVPDLVDLTMSGIDSESDDEIIVTPLSSPRKEAPSTDISTKYSKSITSARHTPATSSGNIAVEARSDQKSGFEVVPPREGRSILVSYDVR